MAKKPSISRERAERFTESDDPERGELQVVMPNGKQLPLSEAAEHFRKEKEDAASR